ncbi:putative RNA-directed DNA polymerase [Tanacetum coccineum]
MLPLFSYQKLLPYIDDTSTSPPETIQVDGNSAPNLAFSSWTDLDQRAVILLNSSLTEEAAAEVLGLSNARSIWAALEAAYSNFSSACDKLAAISQPVDEMDKIHWFLCGLSPSFETFSTAIRTSRPSPLFQDLLSQEKNHEMFLQSLNGSDVPPAAFISQESRSPNTMGRSSNNPRSGGTRGGGRGRGDKCPPHCQLWNPDWYVDTGATAHMTSSTNNVSQPAPYSGNMHVIFGNGNRLPVSHMGTYMVSKKLLLRDDREIKHVIAKGLYEDVLYVLRDGPTTLVASSSGVSNKASFELWHKRLGHISFDVILGKRLSFELNPKRSLHPLDLIHCDLWGSTLVLSGGYLYYVIFVDDYWNGYLRKGRKTKPKRQNRTWNGKAWKRQSQVQA